MGETSRTARWGGWVARPAPRCVDPRGSENRKEEWKEQQPIQVCVNRRILEHRIGELGFPHSE